jgi:hypothetical protein
MAISSPINVGNVTRGVNSLRNGLGLVTASAQNIKSILFKKTQVKRQAISGKKILQKRRRENILRKDQEDLLEASGIKPTIRGTRNAIVDSTKGFLGRILDFVGTLFVGWLLYNLPTIIAFTKDLIVRIQTLFGALTGFIGNIFNIFGDIGHILSGVLSDIVHLDFLDTHKQVQNAFNDLNTHFDNMGKQFEDGVNVFKTSLGEGKGEEPIPSTGTPSGQTPFGQPQYPDTGGAAGGGGTVSPQAVYAYLKQMGVDDTHALGIMANIQGESGFEIGVSEKSGGGGIGLFQYTEPSRKAAFLRAVPDYKKNWQGQVKFAINESVGPQYLRMNFSSPEEAAAWWMRNWEVPASREIPKRDRIHNAFIKSFKSGKLQAPQAQFGQPQYSDTGGALTKTKKGPYNYNTYGYAPSNGQVQYITGDVSQKNNYESSHGGGNYHDHLAFKDRETTLKAYNFFRSKGFQVTEYNVTSGHSTNSLHYVGRAFDIPGGQWGGRGAIGSKEYQGSAKVRAALAEFLGTPDAQVSSPSSTTTVGALTPERRGPTIAVMNQSQQAPSGGGGGVGGGGDGAVLSIPSSDALNSLIKQNLLLDLAYT